jgi:hypothetical protein
MVNGEEEEVHRSSSVEWESKTMRLSGAMRRDARTVERLIGRVGQQPAGAHGCGHAVQTWHRGHTETWSPFRPRGHGSQLQAGARRSPDALVLAAAGCWVIRFNFLMT